MKIVVTGGAGFIGSHICEALHLENDVHVIDNLRSGYKKNLDGLDITFHENDIRNPEILDEILPGTETVFHLAALISVPESMEEPAECISINTFGTVNLLEACKRHKVKNIVLSSSAAIYGDNPDVPKKETMLPEPRSPYGITKLDGEYYFDLYRREYNMNAVCCRYFNVFGPRQDPSSQYAAAVPIFISNALQNRDIKIYGDGLQTRDFIFVKDIAAANNFLAENGIKDNSLPLCNVFNVGYGKSITINDLAEKCIEITGSSSKIIYMPERPGDVKHSLADNSRLKQSGCNLNSDMNTGLEKTIDYFSSKI
ncbi:MAG: NAD-dependent epimerase/dehydratase family protein [Fibrobacterota bacterium]